MAKRSQLQVGQEWAYSNKRQHEYSAWTHNHYKATIVAIEPYKKSYGGKIWKTAKGNGVLVEVQGYNGKFQKVLQLSQLWIPWAEYEVGQAEYHVQYKISEAKARVAQAEREKFKQEIYNPAYKEFIKVIEQFNGGKYVSGLTRIEELPVEVLQAITQLAKEREVV
jgi:hypothetical protein